MVTVCLTVMEVGAETGENWEGCREREREVTKHNIIKRNEREREKCACRENREREMCE